MKKLLAFLFSIFISFNSYGEWTQITEDENHVDFYYVDKESIIKNAGYVYYWELADFDKSLSKEVIVMSAMAYKQVDCQMNRYNILSDYYYSNQMGNGELVHQSDVPDTEWTYVLPDSIVSELHNYICAYVK